jgi:hypothetical protein
MIAEFNPDEKYFFIGSKILIENINENNFANDNKICLGNFIKYIAVPLWGDWLDDGKAEFEFGIISKNDYNKIIIL